MTFVRHKRLNVTGVIIGWDFYGRIEKDRYEDVSKKKKNN
jgi:hypothetical protein